MPITPVILAGGQGARLAPLSTPDRPKPFVPLPQGGSLLSHTLQRAQAEGWAAPVVIGQARHRHALLNHARDAGVMPAAILLEPAVKNTAMAVACVVQTMLVRQPDAVLAFLPADHWITPVAVWQASVRQAAAHVRATAAIGLLGSVPTSPDPGLGYIVPVGGMQASGIRPVAAFVEKPSAPEQYWQSAYWNAGQCVATARCLAALFATHAPALWQLAAQAVAQAEMHWEFHELSAMAYDRLSAPCSFDRVILEPAAASCVVVPCDAGWQDVGTWEGWQRFTGLSPASFALPTRVDRPWGYYELLHEAPDRIEKRLTLYPGCRISLQRHMHRTEQWRVLSGQADIELEGVLHQPNASDIIYIEAGMWHRLHNRGHKPLIIHEIQIGNPDEADIERREDDYGRCIVKTY